MCSPSIDRTLRSKRLQITLYVIAIVCVVISVHGESVTARVMSDDEMKTFGNFRDGTYAAFIAIFSMALTFIQNMYTQRVHMHEASERTKQAAIYAESLHENNAVTKQSAERIEKALDTWAKTRPCLSSFKLLQEKDG